MKRISATDAVFLDLETPNAPMIIGGLFILDPSTAPGSFVRHRDILGYIEDRLHLAPALRRKLVYHPLGLDEPRLIDDPDFDLEFHVRHLGLPKPRDWRQLKILTARLISRPMDMHRPLWEMYLIEGLEALDGIPHDAFGVLLKMHHATFDGIAVGSAIAALLQSTPDYHPTPPTKRWVPERKPDMLGWTISSLQEGMSQWLANIRSTPGVGKGVVATMRQSVADFGSTKGREKAPPPKTRFQQRITTHRVWDFVRFDMNEIQDVRAKLGKPKMNDLLLCLIGGALRGYLEHHGELPPSPLQAFIPVNVRGAQSADEGGNHVSGFRVTLETNIPDPYERLIAIADVTRKAKEQVGAVGGDFAGSLLGMTPYSLRSRLMRGMAGFSEQFDVAMPAVASTVITNAPLPRGGHYFTGAKVITYAGFGPVNDFVGLFHTITGADFEVNISFTSCREILPDVDVYRECLQASYAELKALDTRALSFP